MPMQARGIAVFPRLNEPDTKFDAAGVYSTRLRMTADAAAPLLSRLEKMQEAAVAEAQAEKKGKRVKQQDLPIEPELDEDGNETGNFILKAKMKASGVSKKTGKPWSRKFPLFDSNGQPTNVNVGGGSEIVIAFEPSAYNSASIGVGVTLRLEAAQVIRVAGMGQSSGNFGFAAVEGGFVDEGDVPTGEEPVVTDSADDYEF